MFTFLVDKSSLNMPKMVNFGEFLKIWSLRSKSVTRQGTFKRTKIDEKWQNWNFKYDILSAQKFIKNAKNGQFGEILKIWSLRSNSVTRHVTFIGTKMLEKAKIEKFKCYIMNNSGVEFEVTASDGLRGRIWGLGLRQPRRSNLRSRPQTASMVGWRSRPLMASNGCLE